MSTSSSSPLPLSGASVLVAGATGGLGAAICGELADRGATLTMVSRSIDEQSRPPVAGRRLALDLRDPASGARAVEAAVAHGGRLDAVVNAVGVVAFGPVAELSTDAMEELFLTNVFLPIMLAQHALPRIERGGALVHVSGVIAEQNLPGMAAYGASKAALRSFDEALAREARRSGIRVLDVRPPHTETGLADRPIEGAAPRFPEGVSPELVARVIVDAIEDGRADLPASSFEPAGAPA